MINKSKEKLMFDGISMFDGITNLL